MPLSRRSFVAWIGSLTAAVGLGARARPLGAPITPALQRAGELQPDNTLDIAVLTKLGDVILPSELRADGIARVSRGFATWIAKYRKGAELVHPYGSPSIAYTGDSPASRWRQQLDALQRAAHDRHHRAFTALTRDQREEIIRAALANERLDRLPDPLSANHVAVALMAYYFGSPEATDLCYRAKIGKNQCRPLAHSSREPLPVVWRQRGA
jgi:hypothetical protein